MKKYFFSILSFCALMVAFAPVHADVSIVGFSSVSMDDVVAVSDHKHMPGCGHSLAAEEGNQLSSNNTDNDVFAKYAVMRTWVVAEAISCSCVSASTGQSPVADNAWAACHRQPDYGAT